MPSAGNFAKLLPLQHVLTFATEPLPTEVGVVGPQRASTDI